jgi:hypothetical protein
MTRYIALLAVLAAVVGYSTAVKTDSADAATRVGIANQDYTDFGNPLWRDLRWRRVRYIAPWNVALKRSDRNYFAQYLSVARLNRLEVFVTFNVANGSRCPRRPCRLPSVRSYKRAFRAFRKRFPSVRVIAPWNEANHRSQPTFRRPKRAAQYYKIAKRYCRRCTVVAADVIDERNMVRWLRVFKRYVRGRRLWGLHNYKDTNPRRGQTRGGTRRLLRTVRGQVWLTETGGIVTFRLPGGKTLFRTSTSRASRALTRMFRLARRYRRRVKRVYVYDWQQAAGRNRFDAGLLNKSGRARRGYRTVKRNLASRQFNP